MKEVWLGLLSAVGIGAVAFSIVIGVGNRRKETVTYIDSLRGQQTMLCESVGYPSVSGEYATVICRDGSRHMISGVSLVVLKEEGEEKERSVDRRGTTGAGYVVDRVVRDKWLKPSVKQVETGK